ncbi:MAG: hypothetical protein INH41_27910 [Myxococcaceae bacterium]|nr:hypothetical protein [Myxococcaceae bacterium]MCA3016227.1 hypothetical protein [Myxococcaceae bacterium]
MAARRSQTLSADEKRVLLERIADLELRMRHLEARVRREAAEARARGTTGGLRAAARVVRPERPRPRCPGCTLELPKGPRGVECVWCGFRFDAHELFAGRQPRAHKRR